ncbi:DNA gyrase subunit A [Pararhizobium sp. BT-229]|uniref:DNA gyrase subunit A n=1 Tax=Pararhizobium sp. BT-229 TaxID=2986923 RepID=UPI0021F7AB6D|nr:DNA gyrase subunit A [Pararhizobium sp. BT-229]MCV9963594.1 DNA gyrase subunit A [Pararhizobium sp. BT-229]
MDDNNNENHDEIDEQAVDQDYQDQLALAGVKRSELTDTVSKKFIDYAMSVIVARALPDVRDGMKPVHRRIIYAGDQANFRGTGTSYFKSARFTGETMGKYHPHGNSAIYEAMVRMAQPWQLLHPLIASQGNWGSRDGDGAAAERYTEARLARITEYLLHDLDKDTVDWRDNYDGKLQEPKVLPAKFPNLLVNGQIGIAVGMATSIPTHNLGEVLDACAIVLQNPDATLDDILAVMPGPDFPTGGTIMGLGGIRQSFETGRGSIRMTGKFEIEELKGGKSQIVITELPYGVSAKQIIVKVAELAEKKDGTGKRDLEGLADVRDESGKGIPMRVVIELKKDVDPNITLNFLRKKTNIVCNFSTNMVVLNSQGQPERMGVMQVLREFVKFRQSVIRRRTIHDLNKARDSLYKLVGLYAAVSIVDEVIRLIRSSSTTDEAHAKLMALELPISPEFRVLLNEADPDEDYGDVFRLSDTQATTILEMRLSKLTSFGLDSIAEEVREISANVRGFIAILNDIVVLNEVVLREWAEVKDKFATKRQTTIDAVDYDELDEADLVERKDIIITVSKSGYVKRTDIDAYREQKRGGKGRNGMETKDDDYVHTTLKCTTKTPLVVFTTYGKAHAIMAYKFPEGTPASKGRPLVNFVALDKGESVAAIISMPETAEELVGKSLVFVTSFGTIRRNDASDFANIKANGKIAIDLKDEHGASRGDLVSVILTSDDRDILITTEQGYCCRSPVDDLRVYNSRKSVGVKGINLGYGNRVIGASDLNHVEFSPQDRDAYQAGGTFIAKDDLGNEKVTVLTAERMQEMKDSEEMLLTITSLGFGKLSSAHEYRVTNRGGKGIMAANVGPQTGNLVACLPAKMEDGLILTTDGGQTIRTRVGELRTSGRMTKGVRTFRLSGGQKIVGVVLVGGDDVPETPDDPSADAAPVGEAQE